MTTGAAALHGAKSSRPLERVPQLERALFSLARPTTDHEHPTKTVVHPALEALTDALWSGAFGVHLCRYLTSEAQIPAAAAGTGALRSRFSCASRCSQVLRKGAGVTNRRARTEQGRAFPIGRSPTLFFTGSNRAAIGPAAVRAAPVRAMVDTHQAIASSSTDYSTD